ncbi:helix-turn-helix transcriptional regulator [Arcanobacterium canis]
MIEYLSLTGLAHRIGISPNTARAYAQQGRLPKPDAIIGGKPGGKLGWLPETIDTWQANRPGQGARTDLKNT